MSEEEPKPTTKPVHSKIELKKKICMFGDPGVGKTSLIRKFVIDKYEDKYISTIGTKVSKKAIDLSIPSLNMDFSVSMQIWDVAGQKGYKVFHEIYLQGANAVLSVCDITRRDTFESLKGSPSIITKHAGSVPIVFLFNKCDLMEQAQISIEEIQQFQSVRKAPCYLTSAKTGENVEEAFQKLAEMLAKMYLIEQSRRAAASPKNT